MHSFLELNKQTQVAVADYLYHYIAFPGIIPLVAQSDMITQLSCFPSKFPWMFACITLIYDMQIHTNRLKCTNPNELCSQMFWFDVY